MNVQVILVNTWETVLKASTTIHASVQTTLKVIIVTYVSTQVNSYGGKNTSIIIRYILISNFNIFHLNVNDII